MNLIKRDVREVSASPYETVYETTTTLNPKATKALMGASRVALAAAVFYGGYNLLTTDARDQPVSEFSVVNTAKQAKLTLIADRVNIRTKPSTKGIPYNVCATTGDQDVTVTIPSGQLLEGQGGSYETYQPGWRSFDDLGPMEEQADQDWRPNDAWLAFPADTLPEDMQSRLIGPDCAKTPDSIVYVAADLAYVRPQKITLTN